MLDNLTIRPLVVKLPQTTTLLALGFLAGLLLFTPMIAWIGESVPPDYREDVSEIVKLIRDGMLLILGYYFSKVVNAGQENLAQRAMDKAPDAPPTPPLPAVPPAATEPVPCADTGELPASEKL